MSANVDVIFELLADSSKLYYYNYVMIIPAIIIASHPSLICVIKFYCGVVIKEDGHKQVPILLS